MKREIPEGKWCEGCPFSVYESHDCPIGCNLFLTEWGAKADCWEGKKCEECLKEFGEEGAVVRIKKKVHLFLARVGEGENDV